MGFNCTGSQYLLGPHGFVTFTQGLPACSQQMQYILERLEIFLPAYYSENAQKQIQGLKDKSAFVYALLRALTDFIIFPTE